MESPIAQRRCQTETTGKRGLRSCPTEPPVVSAQNLRSDLTTGGWFRRLTRDVPSRRDRPHARRCCVGRFSSPAFVAAAPVDGIELGGFDRGRRRSGNTATAVGEVNASGNRRSTGSRANRCSHNPPRAEQPPKRAFARPSEPPAIKARAIIGTSCGGQPGSPLTAGGRYRRNPSGVGGDLRLVHRGRRDSGSAEGEGASRVTVRSSDLGASRGDRNRPCTPRSACSADPTR